MNKSKKTNLAAIDEKVYKDFLDIIRDYPLQFMSKKSGISMPTIIHWRYEGNSPSILTASKFLKSIGYELQIVKKNNEDEEEF